MNRKSFQRIVFIAIVAGGLAVTAVAQVPLPPAPPLPGLDIRITTGRPPALRYEHRSPSPGAGYVWVSGFWYDDRGHWEWSPGRWELPPQPNVYWIAPRYVHSGGSYIYEPGHWSIQTLAVGDEVREHRAWRQHERDHEREMERERNRSNYEREEHEHR
jgi:hypothetical protein